MMIFQNSAGRIQKKLQLFIIEKLGFKIEQRRFKTERE
jgi:hypothetical protein